ncbi:hypothetical protein D3C78_1378580 [compost metagenome]
MQRFSKFRIINRYLCMSLIQPVAAIAPYKRLQSPVDVKACTILIKLAVTIRILGKLLVHLDELIPCIRLVLIRQCNACCFKHCFVVAKRHRTNVLRQAVNAALTRYIPIITVNINAVFPNVVEVNVGYIFRNILQHSAICIGLQITRLIIKYIRYAFACNRSF